MMLRLNRMTSAGYLTPDEKMKAILFLFYTKQTNLEFAGSDADLVTMLNEKMAERDAGEYLEDNIFCLVISLLRLFTSLFIIAALVTVEEPEDLLTRFMKYYFPRQTDNATTYDSSSVATQVPQAPAVAVAAVAGTRTEPAHSQLQSYHQPVRPPLPHSPEQPRPLCAESPDIVHQASDASESPGISWMNTESASSQLRQRRSAAVRVPGPPK